MAQNIIKDKNLYKILGPVSSRLITELSQAKKNVFSFEEAAQILKTDNKQVKKLLHDLVKKGWLKRIEKGKYFLVPLTADTTKPYTINQFLIASKLVHPYYIGFWSMLNYYGYTEQLVNTIFIVSPKKKKNLSLLGIDYKFIKTHEEKMFGLTEIKVNDMAVQVSDKEKTLLDCLDHPEYCGGITEVIKGIWNSREEIDSMKILEYAKKMGNSAVIKRLGYLLEILEMDKKIPVRTLQKMIRKGFSPLDPLLPQKGQYNSQWNLIVNIP
ncbi:MAG: type IV toxin-antitoxin system AbiEi family antitoxin, partial [Thermodesulfovibrionales bacterium]|nr:type IV toxin-antitoxin system AbiEi family antitoxin [Thermodesulfovibrionales bacterium]